MQVHARNSRRAVASGTRSPDAISIGRPLRAAAARCSHICTASSLRCSTDRIVKRRSFRCQASSRPAVFLFGFGGGVVEEEYYDDEEYTVLKLQVGIFGDIAKWQRDLERLSTLYDTSEEGGLHAILGDTLQQLVRNTEYIGYASSGGKIFNNADQAEAKFNEVSFEERSKFKEETLTSVDGRIASKVSSTRMDPGMKDLDQWMCVTLLLAVERELKLPKAQSVWELKSVLKMLAGVSVDELLAFELLWTPQDNGDAYSKDELLADYPAMVTLG